MKIYGQLLTVDEPTKTGKIYNRSLVEKLVSAINAGDLRLPVIDGFPDGEEIDLTQVIGFIDRAELSENVFKIEVKLLSSKSEYEQYASSFYLNGIGTVDRSEIGFVVNDDNYSPTSVTRLPEYD